MGFKKGLAGASFAFLFLVIAFFLREGYRQAFGPVCNPDGAWSVAIPLTASMLLGAAFLLGVLWCARASRSLFEYAGWLLLFAGGVSNLGERIVFGCILDYWRIPGPLFFNGADVAITSGILILLFALWKRRPPRFP